MILEEIDIKKRELAIFIDLKRIRLTYRIYQYIDTKGKCVINDIKKKYRSEPQNNIQTC